MRTIDWVDGAIELVDQTLLPHQVVIRRVRDLDELVADIQRLAVRGAPALGVAGALGVALAARSGLGPDQVRAASARLRDARPTAVNLAWGVGQALEQVDHGAEAVLARALALRDADIAACVAMGRAGADLVRALVVRRPIRVITICNTGALAAVERGTALGVAQTLFEQGDLGEVLALETRPLLQGARLTVWELAMMGAPHRLVVDGAAAHLLAEGAADVALIGADRVAANGDAANKIGSLGLALAARHAGVPFLVVAPESSLDRFAATGSEVTIEERDPDEVRRVGSCQVAGPGVPVLNPAFDVTPAALITAIVTERRIIQVGRGERPAG